MFRFPLYPQASTLPDFSDPTEVSKLEKTFRNLAPSIQHYPKTLVTLEAHSSEHRERLGEVLQAAAGEALFPVFSIQKIRESDRAASVMIRPRTKAMAHPLGLATMIGNFAEARSRSWQEPLRLLDDASSQDFAEITADSRDRASPGFDKECSTRGLVGEMFLHSILRQFGEIASPEFTLVDRERQLSVSLPFKSPECYFQYFSRHNCAPVRPNKPIAELDAVGLAAERAYIFDACTSKIRSEEKDVQKMIKPLRRVVTSKVHLIHTVFTHDHGVHHDEDERDPWVMTLEMPLIEEIDRLAEKLHPRMEDIANLHREHVKALLAARVTGVPSVPNEKILAGAF